MRGEPRTRKGGISSLKQKGSYNGLVIRKEHRDGSVEEVRLSERLQGPQLVEGKKASETESMPSERRRCERQKSLLT